MDAGGEFLGTTSTGGKGYGTVFELERKDERQLQVQDALSLLFAGDLRRKS